MLPWIAPLFSWLPDDPAKYPRVMLLRGQAGLGKRSTASLLAKAILCEAGGGIEACGQCASCLLVASGNHPDFRLVEAGAAAEDSAEETAETVVAVKPAKKASRQILVDQIRALGSEFIWITPHRGRAKVVLISPAEDMHPSAANAVLKMLEEPPGDTYFVLVSHRPERVLPTIRSRCFQIAFAAPGPELAVQWLKKNGAGDAKVALATASNSPLSALNSLADADFWDRRKALLEQLAAPRFDALTTADRAESLEGPQLARLLLQWTADLALLKSGGRERYHVDYRAGLESISRVIHMSEIFAWNTQVVDYARSCLHPLNKRLALESLFSSYPVNRKLKTGNG
ncbi:MAG: DNA polymerase III subunit delta' [Burkholderiales bacterium]